MSDHCWKVQLKWQKGYKQHRWEGDWVRSWGENGLLVRVLWAAMDIKDGISLGHLGVNPDFPKERYLNKYKVSRGRHSGGYS